VNERDAVLAVLRDLDEGTYARPWTLRWEKQFQVAYPGGPVDPSLAVAIDSLSESPAVETVHTS